MSWNSFREYECQCHAFVGSDCTARPLTPSYARGACRLVLLFVSIVCGVGRKIF